MANQKFRAMVVEESPDGTFRKSIREKYTARYIPLEKLDENISLILKAQQKGRVVVDLEK